MTRSTTSPAKQNASVPKPERRNAATTRIAALPPGIKNLLAIFLVGVAVVIWASASDNYRTFEIATVAAIFCAASGLTVLTGTTGQISVGHGAFMAVGAYTVALVQPRLTDSGIGPNTAFLLALVAAVVIATALGTLFGLAGARVEGPYLAGLTLALLIVVPAATTMFSGVLNGENGLSVPMIRPPESLAAAIPAGRWQAFWAIGAAVLTAVVFANLLGGRQGRAWRALRDDTTAAALCGVEVRRMRVEAFALSSAAASLGGGLLAMLNGQASPAAFGLQLSVQILTAIVLGGLGSLLGSLLGSAFVVFFPAWLTDFVMGLPLSTQTSQRLQGNAPLFAYGLGVLLVVIFAPRGLAGLLGSVRRRVSSRTSGARA